MPHLDEFQGLIWLDLIQATLTQHFGEKSKRCSWRNEPSHLVSELSCLG